MLVPSPVILALLLVLIIIPASTEQRDVGKPCLVEFPKKFHVTTGTTVPMRDAPPIAQSGAIYVDADAGLVRIDQFYLGLQHSFMADLNKKRAYVFERTYVNSTTSESNGLTCRVFSTQGAIQPQCVPSGFSTHVESYLVRGVPVTRHTGFDREDGRLLQIDYYTLDTCLPSFGKFNNFTTPWRIETRLRPGSELKEIAGAPFSTPNWRYFGQPMFDELAFPAASQGFSKEILPWVSEYDPVTVDFYNFVPHTPDANVFVIPRECVEAEDAWERAKESATFDKFEEKNGERSGKSNFQLTMTHRFLIEWSVSAVAQSVDG
ncbi:unnamed protein product [Phytomonas sp. EM1]|nr:unnamed protein product [Phytomonas sp. EM1]|eukprot:CCW62012.1 unnamed protein product [Phytomonas sp. isolate EM1]